MPRVKAENQTFWTSENKPDKHVASKYLRQITDLAIKKTNKNLKEGDFFTHKINFKTLFSGDNQSTQTTTKALQTLINLNLEEAANELKIELKVTPGDGYDYILVLIINGERYEFKIEFKLIADSIDTDDYFATGNKISALKDEDGNSIGKKVPLLWTIKYHLSDDGLVDDFASFFIDGDMAKHKKSGWYASSSSKVSLSQYILRKSDLDAVDVLHGRLYYTKAMGKIYNLTSTYGPYSSEDKKK